MNYWTQLSRDFASQRNYLDELYKVYPISPNSRRPISQEKELKIKRAFDSRNNSELIRQLLSLDLFPLKDSYVAFLKRDPAALARNPETINRLAGNLYHLGFAEMMDKCTQPKETNRQIGPMFKRWLDQGTLGAAIIRSSAAFLASTSNCVFNASDLEMQKFAHQYLGYNREKGIDFIAKFNDKYIFAETKFLTDFGDHQNAQFADAISTLSAPLAAKAVPNEVIRIAILDGVLYIKGHNKMSKYLEEHTEQLIMSSLVLREFLYSL